MASVDVLAGLNDAQREAVTHDGGPLMVLAGPGTGKTRAITHRVAHMVLERGVDPRSILAVTYTVKAAAQLRERLAGLIGERAQSVVASTFHGMGHRLVREFAGMLGYAPFRSGDRGGVNGAGRAGQIIDSAQSRMLLRELIVENGLFTHVRARGVSWAIELVRSHLGLFADAAVSDERLWAYLREAKQALGRGESISGEKLDDAAIAAQRVRLDELAEIGRAVTLYRAACRERSWLSFDDLIMRPIELLRDHPRAAAIVRDRWRHIVVDEFQDDNLAQIKLLELLAPPSSQPDLCVVGDDDQSIYEFRGADDRAFARFAETWTGASVVKLEENYRSSERIVALCNSVIARAHERFAPDKRIVAAGKQGKGPPVEIVNLDEEMQDGEAIASMILLDKASMPERAYASYAVVARSHGDLDRVRIALELEGIPAVVARPASPLDDEGVRDVLAWVEMLAEPRATSPVVRVLIRPGVGAPLERVSAWERAYRGEASRFQNGEPGVGDPSGFAEFLEARFPDDAFIAKLAARRAEFAALDAAEPASRTIDAIVRAVDPVHIDLPEPRTRSKRVEAIVCLLRFATERQERLQAPGDLRAFHRYFNELEGDDREMRSGALDDRVDGGGQDVADLPDGVRLLTAHSAKGLEFDTVFVPRVSPGHGYPKTRGDEREALPAELVGREDDADASVRKLREERRVFYVACSRAERRLVLLAKKMKSRSTSTHFVQEITLSTGHASPATRLAEEVDASSIFERVATAGLGLAPKRQGIEAKIDAENRTFRLARRRSEIFQNARRDARTAAAAALARVESPSADAERIAEAASELESMAERLAVLSYAETHGGLPKWASDESAIRLANAALKRALREDELAAASSATDGPRAKAPLRLSYSSIKDYLGCPRCWYLKHILNHRSTQSVSQVVGNAVHAALETYFRRLREVETGDGAGDDLFSHTGNAQLGVDALVQLGRDAFFRFSPRGGEVAKEDLQQVEAQLRLVLEKLHDPMSNILELEHHVDFPYGPHTFTAYIDRIDQITLPGGDVGFRIVDYKSGDPYKSRLEPKPDDLQLGTYALALQHIYGPEALHGVAEYWLLETGQRGVISLSDLKLDKVRKAIDGATEGMLAGRFEKGPRCYGNCDILGPG